MPNEVWKPIEDFPTYSVSNHGRICFMKADRILSLSTNQSGLVYVGLFRDKVQHHRSVPLLVAKAFVPPVPGPFDTPINLNGDREDNRAENLAWRPRWFAVKYFRQFRFPYPYPIDRAIVDLRSGEVIHNSFECAMRYGLLEEDLVKSIMHRTFVWPTYQTFGVVDD